MRLISILLLTGGLALASVDAQALDLGDTLRHLQAQYEGDRDSGGRVTQKNGGKSLSDAIDQVRRQTGGRILSAETKVSGNREVHHIKVLTKDGKVKTVRVPGRRRDR